MADFNNSLWLLSNLLVTVCRRYDAGMSENRFKFVNRISEEKKFYVLVETATAF